MENSTLVSFLHNTLRLIREVWMQIPNYIFTKTVSFLRELNVIPRRTPCHIFFIMKLTIKVNVELKIWLQATL